MPIYALTPQNEPLNPTSGYPSMSFPATDESNFIKNNLGPTLKAQGLTTKILGYDHNWDQPGYMQTLYGDATTASYVAGGAWHFYGGDASAMNDSHNQYPAKDIYFTEGSSGTWFPNLFDSNTTYYINVFRNWAKTYTDWNLVLDTNHGPTNGGCTTCTGFVTVNQATGGVSYTSTFYTMGHISKFVVPGAKRIATTGYAQGVYNVAFKNADGSKALVVYNQNGSSSTVAIKWGNESFKYTLPATSLATFKWSGTQSGSTVIPSTTTLQASAFEDSKGARLEASSDSGGGQDVGYTSSGSYLLFKNVDLTNVSSVNARLANGGSATSLEFHADSPTGTLLGSVAANVTGGWQTWATNSAALSGATGVHDFYVVFKGSTNLNWVSFSSSQSTTNLLGNPGFESGNLSSWSDWTPSTQANYARQVDTDAPRTGTYKLTHYASTAYQQTSYQAVSVPNGTYRASAWVRSGGGQTNLRLEATNYGGSVMYSTDLGSTAVPNTWTQLTINNINVTTGTVTIGVYSNAPGNNWAAIDDFELVKQ